MNAKNVVQKEYWLMVSFHTICAMSTNYPVDAQPIMENFSFFIDQVTQNDRTGQYQAVPDGPFPSFT